MARRRFWSAGCKLRLPFLHLLFLLRFFLSVFAQVLERMVAGLESGAVAPEESKRASKSPRPKKQRTWMLATMVAGVVLALMTLFWCMLSSRRNARLVLKEL